MQGNFVLPGASVYSSVLGFGNPSFTSWCTNSMDPGTFFGGSGFGCCWTTVDAAGGFRVFRGSGLGFVWGGIGRRLGRFAAGRATGVGGGGFALPSGVSL